MTIAKTAQIGRLPAQFQFGVEYSVVSQDDFGQRARAQIKLNVIPVIPPLVEEPIFGGRE